MPGRQSPSTDTNRPQGGFKGRYRLRPSGIRTTEDLRADEALVEADLRDFELVQGIVEVGRGRNAGGRSARRGRAAGRRDPD